MSFNLNRLLRDVFAPHPGENALVLTDLPKHASDDTPAWRERRNMAGEWREAFNTIGVNCAPVLRFPATGAGNAELPAAGEQNGATVSIHDALAQTDIVVALTHYSATAPLSAAAKRQGTLRGASLPGVLRSMEKTALAADYAVVAALADRLAERLTRAQGTSISFSTGHEVFFDLRFRTAKSDNGRCHRHEAPKIINLPGGEAFIVPYEGERPEEPSHTNGMIPMIAEGALAVLRIEANRIAEVTGTGEGPEKLRAFFEQDPARCNVAELGLGCNDWAVVTGAVLEDEKAGLHWAYGRSEHLGGTVGPEAFAAPSLVVHNDVVYARECPITISRLLMHESDGNTNLLMRNSRYDLPPEI